MFFNIIDVGIDHPSKIILNDRIPTLISLAAEASIQQLFLRFFAGVSCFLLPVETAARRVFMSFQRFYDRKLFDLGEFENQ